ncbi:hypothetical protein LQT97_23240 [Brucella pseudogrignonensis]|uniref:hypothetical protein n=1 Tax=Brucella pseudogrignonensis TaxID=419475 RepID=UPI001E53282D|nr:hypothetical protein [Brucella pseudogrignonensis]MCD4514152.1 hypothetical protein [Brucella pseudogrignonensis]
MPNSSIPANAEGLSKFSRRSILTGGATVCASAATLALGEAATAAALDTKILALLREYNQLTAAVSTHLCVTDDEDEELEVLFYRRRDEVEDELLATPCTTAADFAAKMIVATCQGDMCLDWEKDQIWIEARSLSGWKMV